MQRFLVYLEDTTCVRPEFVRDVSDRANQIKIDILGFDKILNGLVKVSVTSN